MSLVFQGNDVRSSTRKFTVPCRVSRNREINFLRHENEPASRVKGAKAWIVTRKSRHGYWFLIRYQLCARFGVRAAYYICDPLISTSNPPTTHSWPGEPPFEAPRNRTSSLLESITETFPPIGVASIQPVLPRVSITRPSRFYHRPFPVYEIMNFSHRLRVDRVLPPIIRNFGLSEIHRCCLFNSYFTL